MAAHSGNEAVPPLTVGGMHVLATDKGDALMPEPDEMLGRPVHSNVIIRARIIALQRHMSKRLDNGESPGIEAGYQVLGRADSGADDDPIGSVLPHAQD